MLCRVKDIAVGNGFLHRVAVEWNPERPGIGALELAIAGKDFLRRRCRETDDKVLLHHLFSTRANLIIERILKLVEDVYHLTVVLTGVRAVDLVDEEHHTHPAEFLLCTVKGILQVKELLYVYHDDTLRACQRINEGLLVASLNEHALVDVHVHHHRVELVTKLQTVDNDHYLVVSPRTVIAQVFQLQCRPSDDVALAESGGILHQQRIDILVVAERVTLGNELVYLLRRNVHILHLTAELVEIVVGVLLMVEHLMHAGHNLVAAVLLFGSGRNQCSSVGSADLLALLGLVVVLDEVVVENLLLYHLL